MKDLLGFNHLNIIDWLGSNLALDFNPQTNRWEPQSIENIKRIEIVGKLNPDQLPRTDYWVKDFGLESKEIDLYYNLTDKEIITKKESLNLHSSQIKNDLFPMNISNKDFKLLFGREYFKIIN